MGAYTEFGPFTDGSPPGLDATFFDGVENWILQADNPPVISVTGSTSGTAHLYMPLQGVIYKVALLYLNNFRNGGGSVQNLALPTAFLTVAAFYIGSFPAFTLLSGGSAINCGVITALASGGGTVNVQTTLGQYMLGDTASGFDTVSFNSGQVTSHTGIAVFRGI